MRRRLSASGSRLVKVTLILSALIVGGCGGYHAATDVKDGAPSLPFACTSFAVYSDETFYGMNFDYLDTEVRFTINSSGDLKVFQMGFSEGNGFAETVGMNSAGLFASCQMLYPEAPATTSPRPSGLYPWQVYEEALFNLDSVADVDEFISDKRVVHWGVTLHDLFADTRGDAMVVEVGDEENVITRIEDDFIVMTNFPNGEFAGQGYEDVEGVGADRYKIAYQNISDHVAAFDVDRGLETLEKAVLSGEASTQASMVFDPDKGEVYIALKGDFSKIWKVSIADGTIETFSGFGRARKMELDASGVLASELEQVPSGGTRWGYAIAIGLAIVLAVGGCLFVVRRRGARGALVVGGIVALLAVGAGVLALRSWRRPPETPPLPVDTICDEGGCSGDTQTWPTDGMTTVYVPGGTFLMGSKSSDSHAQGDESPQHEVHVDAFWIDRTEVTNAMFAAFLNQEGNQSEGGATWLDAEGDRVLVEQLDGEWRAVNGHGDHPAMEVTWYGARAYCEWAGRRLPTEAEWEKAARGTDGRLYPWGDEFDSSLANVDTETEVDTALVTCGPSGCDSYDFTAPVGSYPAGASPYGAQDLAGNVWEWVADWYGVNYYAESPRENPPGPSSGSARVFRGGAWECIAHDNRSALRLRTDPTDSAPSLGFRCARGSGEEASPVADATAVQLAQEGASPNAEGTPVMQEFDAVTTPSLYWPTAAPDEQGMNADLLARVADAVKEHDYDVDSVTVVRNGHIVLDEYFPPFGPDEMHIIHSCTKSIVSALIGIAIDQGYVEGVDQPVLDLFPERAVANLDADKEAMTLEDLLTMSSGLECRDSYLYDWRGLNEMRESDDWVQFMLDLPMAEPAGTRFEYCNGGSFLLSAIIQETTGMSALAFAKENLFGPLGITDVHWPANPAGITIGWGDMHLKPHDMAKIGYLYLNSGQWEGEQVVPVAWVEASTQAHIAAGTLSDRYGYQWWVDDGGYYMALGYAGQFIYVVPDKDMVVVFTSDLAESDFFIPETLLNDYIIPAAD